MNERDWLTCTDPSKLFDYLTSIRPLRMRKLRLFAIACTRRVEYLLTEKDEIGRQVLQLAEQMVEGQVAPEIIAQLQKQIRSHAVLIGAGDIAAYISADCARHNVLVAAYNTLQEDSGSDYRRPSRLDYPRLGGDYLEEPSDLMVAMTDTLYAAHQAAGDEGDWYTSKVIQAESGQQAALLRDIFGNPFCPVTCSPAWRTDTTMPLARQMYESRDWAGMPILADALQDTGCEDEQILGHCRSGGTHVRGCWVIDLILGRQ